jgi:hypothetical protein
MNEKRIGSIGTGLNNILIVPWLFHMQVRNNSMWFWKFT